MEVKSEVKGKHFVLVHGAGHGAWCWYKLKPLLSRAGHRVTALDMAGAGIHPKQIARDGVHTIRDYCEPLIEFMASIPDDHDQRVILVGHSLGGLNLVVVMEMFSQKIETAIFVTAFLPAINHQPSYVLDEYAARMPEGGWLDTEFTCSGDPNESLTTISYGPNFLSLLYHLCPTEDFELALMLKRPSSFFLHELRKAEKLEVDRHQAIRRVYIVCEEDKGIPKDFQWWIAKSGGVEEVKELQGADHMPMLSMPQKLCDCLLEITQK